MTGVYVTLLLLTCVMVSMLTLFNRYADSGISSPKFPVISGENLLGQSFQFPQDFHSNRILVVFAYKESQAEVLKTWIDGLNLLDSTWEWYEMPIISKPLKLGRWFIDGGMLKGIPDVRLQKRVITLYTDRESFSRSLGIQFDEDGAYALVVNRDGRIAGYVSGAFTTDGATKINEWMKLDALSSNP